MKIANFWLVRDYLIVKVLSEATFKYKNNGARNIEIGWSITRKWGLSCCSYLICWEKEAVGSTSVSQFNADRSRPGTLVIFGSIVAVKPEQERNQHTQWLLIVYVQWLLCPVTTMYSDYYDCTVTTMSSDYYDCTVTTMYSDYYVQWLLCPVTTMSSDYYVQWLLWLYSDYYVRVRIWQHTKQYVHA